jgi:sugar phosphate isomerase/epimerase
MSRIGFRTAGFHEWRVDEAVAALGRLGYDGVEICLEHPDCRPESLTTVSAKALAQRCGDAGLEVASVSYHADTEPQDLRRDNAVRALELVPAFGTEVLILNGRRTTPEVKAEALADLERLLGVLLPRAAALGARVALEPEPGLSVGDSADMLRLVERVGSPQLGANLDVGHAFLTDADVTASIRELGASIFHTHLEGMPAGEHRHLLPGEGDLDLTAVCRALRETGYRGYLTVDLFAIADDPLGWAERSLAAMRRIANEASEA